LAPLVEDLNRETAQGNISQKPDRDTIGGTLYERSNSIALAITGAIGYQMADRYGQGKKTNQAMRDESLSFGMRTGDYDFRGIRSDYGALGADLGYNGMDMMGYAEDVMSNLGYTGSENTQEMSRTLAEGERYSGVDAEALSSFMNSSMQIGTVSNADEAK
ncbi:hypothetical protein CVR97_28355, partial [Salmonella enterica subsp. enterica serovar Typhimurium]|uniref:hypothetical protein n=1 Tax=Salmonella enterica TaxID=28901 RepID=UPI000CB46281